MGQYTDAQGIRDVAYGIDIPDGPDVDRQIEALIAKAETRMLNNVPSVPHRVDMGALDIAVVAGVVQDMVLRVLRNPQAARQLGIDDFQVTIDNATSTGELYLSDRERRELSGRRRKSSFGSARLREPRWVAP